MFIAVQEMDGKDERTLAETVLVTIILPDLSLAIL